MFDSTQLTTDQVELLCQYGTYQDQVPDENGDLVDNPQSKTDFANDMVVRAVNNYLQEQFNRNLLSGSGSGSAPLIENN